MRPTTTVERVSDRELLVARTFDAPARLVWEAWTKPDLFMKWWAPKAFGMDFLSCEIDARTGGGYRMVFKHPAAPEPMAFYGRYLEVVPRAKLVWTNDEDGEGAGAVTTVTFEEDGGRTRVVWRDLYPSKQALDGAVASQAASGFEQQFEQLAELLAG